MSFSIRIKNLEELDRAAAELLKHFSTDRIFAFYGEMGVGKTTFINTLFAAHLLDPLDTSKSTTEITSHSFSILF